MLTATDHSYPITKILFVTWLLGLMIMLSINLYALIKVRNIKLTSQPITDTQILALFDNCKSKCNVRRKVRLYKSSNIDSPIMFGIINTYILLPAKTLESFSSQELVFILLHELIHCKSKDILIIMPFHSLQTLGCRHKFASKDSSFTQPPLYILQT